jgi:hypothetical protein
MTPLFFRTIFNVSEVYVASIFRAENLGISFSDDKSLEKVYLALLKNMSVYLTTKDYIASVADE